MRSSREIVYSREEGPGSRFGALQYLVVGMKRNNWKRRMKQGRNQGNVVSGNPRFPWRSEWLTVSRTAEKLKAMCSRQGTRCDSFSGVEDAEVRLLWIRVWTGDGDIQTYPLVEPIISYCLKNLLHPSNSCSNSNLLHLIRFFLFHLQKCLYLSIPQRYNYHLPS